MEAVGWDFVFSLSSLAINWNGLATTCRLSQEEEKGKVNQFADNSSTGYKEHITNYGKYLAYHLQISIGYTWLIAVFKEKIWCYKSSPECGRDESLPSSCASSGIIPQKTYPKKEGKRENWPQYFKIIPFLLILPVLEIFVLMKFTDILH